MAKFTCVCGLSVRYEDDDAQGVWHALPSHVYEDLVLVVRSSLESGHEWRFVAPHFSGWGNPDVSLVICCQRCNRLWMIWTATGEVAGPWELASDGRPPPSDAAGGDGSGVTQAGAAGANDAAV